MRAFLRPTLAMFAFSTLLGTALAALTTACHDTSTTPPAPASALAEGDAPGSAEGARNANGANGAFANATNAAKASIASGPTSPTVDNSPGGSNGMNGGAGAAPDSSGAPGANGSKVLALYPSEKVWLEGRAMGTHLGFAGYTQAGLDANKVRALFADAIDEIKRVETLMTTWRPDSELSRVNAAAGHDAIKVSQETFDVVKEAIHTSEISEGTFDITFETLHGLWKFDQDLDPHPPSDADIAKLLPLVGYKKLTLDPAGPSIFIQTAGTKVSLGGIAKGYGVDRAVALLDKAGLRSFYVQAGGDLFARGLKPDGSPWSAGVRDPRGPDGSYFALLGLQDHAFSTAGDYERSYIVGGKRYHHIIDPRIGKPASASRSVTIWAKSALLADAIDDAVFILGPEKGLKLVESLDGVGAVIVDKDNNVWASDRIKDALKIVRAPTSGL